MKGASAPQQVPAKVDLPGTGDLVLPTARKKSTGGNSLERHSRLLTDGEHRRMTEMTKKDAGKIFRSKESTTTELYMALNAMIRINTDKFNEQTDKFEKKGKVSKFFSTKPKNEVADKTGLFMSSKISKEKSQEAYRIFKELTNYNG